MNTVGVVIGRFQVDNLHAGHHHLLDWVQKDCDELVILVGTTKAKMTTRNPLSYELRRDMLAEVYPQAKIFEIADQPSNEAWSHNVDAILVEKFPDKQIKLYGSRDSFAEYYFGKFSVTMVPELPGFSGTEIRKRVIVPKCAESFRKGIIHAQQNRFPTSYQTVDIGLVNKNLKQILLGRKKDDVEGKWRLPGGFVDPDDQSLELAASRELSEEVGKILTHEFTYVGSFRIDDHRYRGEQDKVMTALFLTYYLGGKPKASDDLAEIKWFPINTDIRFVIESHRQIFRAIVNSVG